MIIINLLTISSRAACVLKAFVLASFTRRKSFYQENAKRSEFNFGLIEKLLLAREDKCEDHSFIMILISMKLLSCSSSSCLVVVVVQSLNPLLLSCCACRKMQFNNMQQALKPRRILSLSWDKVIKNKMHSAVVADSSAIQFHRLLPLLFLCTAARRIYFCAICTRARNLQTI